jgi:cell division protein FtsB
MVSDKIKPRGFHTDQADHHNNIFYRLFSNQRFLAVIGLVLLLLIVLPLARTYSQKRVIENEINGVQKEITQFEKDNQDLKEMLSYLQSDQSLEAQARMNLNLKKPGETVVVIENQGDVKNSDDVQNNEEEASNFKKWFNYFFGS